MNTDEPEAKYFVIFGNGIKLVCSTRGGLGTCINFGWQNLNGKGAGRRSKCRSENTIQVRRAEILQECAVAPSGSVSAETSGGDL